MFRTYTRWTPAPISLPSVTPPWPLCITQFWITWFCDGPYCTSRFLPDLIAMQSSPVLNSTFSQSTVSHASGSKPSLFRPLLSASTPRITTFLQSTG